MIHLRHRETDGQTDDMGSQDRALHYSASRGKKPRYTRYRGTLATVISRYRASLVELSAGCTAFTPSSECSVLRRAKCDIQWRSNTACTGEHVR